VVDFIFSFLLQVVGECLTVFSHCQNIALRGVHSDVTVLNWTELISGRVQFISVQFSYVAVYAPLK